MADLVEAVAGRAQMLEVRAALAGLLASDLQRRAARAQVKAAAWRLAEAAAEATENAAVTRAQIALGGQP